MAAVLLLAPFPAAFPQVQGLPPGVTAEQAARLLKERPELAGQIRAQLFQSGLTPEEIRRQLATQGFDASLLDRFLSGQLDTSLVVSPTMIQALQILGVSPFPMETADSLAAAGGRAAIPRRARPRLFGLELFQRPTTQFQPMLAGPVPDSYRVGPGDVMVLVITGDAEQVHQLSVTREGFVVIPQIGQLFVGNLTMAEVRRVLQERLTRSFSGIVRGTTRFDVTIARLRTIQVYVIGEVAEPGAYPLPSVATVLTALYAAGGPTELGNFRDIQVQRQGRTAASLDVYEYLLRGIATNDIVLEQGDVVFVPVRGTRVSVAGAVVRPAVYEMRPGETLADVVAMAGGLRPDAQTRRLTVFRILPPGEQLPGPMPRAVVDVPLGRATPGPGDGPNAAAAAAIPPLRLEPGDSVVVDSILPPDRSLTVSVGGMVNRPGVYPWSEGVTVRDLVRLARGPSVGADLREGELARLTDDRSGGALAQTMRIPLDSTYLFERDSSGAYLGPSGLAFPAAGSAAEQRLEPYDHVTIFRQPGFELPRTAWIDGEVASPGPYALTRKDERVSDLVRRAGGPMPSAHLAGARFFRTADSTGRVDLDLSAAMGSPGGENDLLLQPGDSLYVPELNGTVKVEGEVNAPVSVRYVPGKGLDYYIGNAGGYTSLADKGRTSVRYADGSARVRSSFLFFHSYPAPGPGSTILVPARTPSQRGFDPAILFTGVVQILATVTTLVIVSRQQ